MSRDVGTRTRWAELAGAHCSVERETETYEIARFFTDPRCFEKWLVQYPQDAFSYRDLVLEGPSAMGKTSSA